MTALVGQNNTPPLLEMTGIVKSFPGVKALRGVDLSLPRSARVS